MIGPTPKAHAAGVATWVVAALGLLPAASVAQVAAGGHQSEVEALRDAIALERAGRRDDAIVAFEQLLDRSPTSLGGLLALERTLRAADRVRDVLPRADHFLSVVPDAAGPWHLKLRVLAEVDSLDGLREAAGAWIAAVPDAPEPVRESARIVGRELGADEARAILEAGVARLGPGSGLDVDLGDLHAAQGRPAEAGAAWARAGAADDTDLDGLVARVRRLQAGRNEATPPLLDALLEQGRPGGHRLAAVRLALVEDAVNDPLAVARRALGQSPHAEREAFLVEVADLAADHRAPAVEAWALSTLADGRQRPDPDADQRLAAASLAAGDTATARAAYGRIAHAAPRGSQARRNALAAGLRLDASSAEPDELEARWRAYRNEFPEAPDADGLAATVAGALARDGDRSAALEVTGQVAGPRSQLERAWLLFEAGDVAAGGDALREALPGLAPGSATEIIQLLAALDRVGPDAAVALAAAQAAMHRGRPAEAGAALGQALERVPAADRPPLLRRAAELGLQRGDTADARGHLERLVVEHAESPEAAEAFLALARVEATRPEGVERARELLRRLILERPQAAVVPAARRELQRLGRDGR